MDVEIAKKNGEVFRLSDYGVVQDFVVNSIDKRTHRENIEGRPGAVNYGSYDGDRTITVPFIFKAHDLHDYAHLRDELYGLLDDGEPFYIREMRRLKYLQYEFVDFGKGHKWSPGTDNQYVNGKQIMVRLNSAISPEQEFKNGNVVLEFISDELPYFESTYTTLELHDSGYSAIAEKYGLVDNIDDEKVKYRFEDEKEVLQTIDLTDFSYIYGFISGTGNVSGVGTSSYTINEGFIDLVEGSIYRFIDRGDSPQLNYWWLYMYNDDESFIERIALINVGGGREHTFIASGTKMKVMINPVSPMSDNKIDPARIGIDVLPELNLLGATKFEVYNAGNVTVEPESMYLNIFAAYVRSAGDFTIRNNTTGDEFILRRESNGSHVRLNGMVVSMGSFANIFRDTNRRFISLAPGDNEFEILNGTFGEIRFEFKYLYK